MIQLVRKIRIEICKPESLDQINLVRLALFQSSSSISPLKVLRKLRQECWSLNKSLILTLLISLTPKHIRLMIDKITKHQFSIFTLLSQMQNVTVTNAIAFGRWQKLVFRKQIIDKEGLVVHDSAQSSLSIPPANVLRVNQVSCYWR